MDTRFQASAGRGEEATVQVQQMPRPQAAQPGYSAYPPPTASALPQPALAHASYPGTAPWQQPAAAGWNAPAPSGYPQGPGQRPGGRGSAKWWGVAIGILVLIVAVVVGWMAIPFNKDAEPGPADQTPAQAADGAAAEPVKVTALTGLLLSPTEAASAIGVPTMGPSKDTGLRVLERMGGGSAVDQECMIMWPGSLAGYEGSGYTAVRRQYLTSPENGTKLGQSVVSFNDAAAAENYVAAAKPKLNKCANRNVNYRPIDEPNAPNRYWSVGAVDESNGVLSVPQVQEGADGWVCQRALAARNNVVIDFFVCGDNLTPSVVTPVVDKIGEKVQAQK
ncbi:sensor domain-containing protein [Mycolicibacterium fortuitum]